jgi:hypothetical protein
MINKDNILQKNDSQKEKVEIDKFRIIISLESNKNATIALKNKINYQNKDVSKGIKEGKMLQRKSSNRQTERERKYFARF